MNNVLDYFRNPQGLTKSERVEYREKLKTGDVIAESKELPEVRPKYTTPTRDSRKPVGFPGWSLDDGSRSSKHTQRHMTP